MPGALATIQKDQGDLPEARASMERAIAIQSKYFGPDHPTFATSLNNLAGICYAEGDRAAACANFEEALSIFLLHFDENHPHVKAVRANIVVACCAAGVSRSDLGRLTTTTNLDAEVSREDNNNGHLSADTSKETIPDYALQVDAGNEINELMTKGLSAVERTIIVQYYYEEKTMGEIGTMLDLSESRVSQMHVAILSKLKASMQQ